MTFFRTAAISAAVALAIGLVACSSDDSSNSATASSCAQAKSVADSCNAQPKEGGVQMTANFDQGKCESGGDAAKKVADCIVANKSNCDCILKCGLTGAC
jgi:hypothetical protein